MNSRGINATEAARNFSEVLNQVKYQSINFEVMRGRELVACIVPATPVGKLAGRGRLEPVFRQVTLPGQARRQGFRAGHLNAAHPPGAHDLIIGATAIRHGFPVLTANFAEFSRMPGLTVLEFSIRAPS